MAKKHNYILGINAYDHDVSGCLLRDGEIACAIIKERITREKHATGFYDEVIDYCLEAEDIKLDDVDLIVRNCYVMPVKDIETRLIYQDEPHFLPDDEREDAKKHPLFLTNSKKVVTISHHLAHAYSAFAVCPFEEGAVMVVDGVGSYAADITEDYPPARDVNPMARESESYYTFSGSKLDVIKKVWLHPVPGFLSDEFFMMAGLGAIYSRVSTYIFGDWNKCGEVMGLAPFGRPNAVKPMLLMQDGELVIPDWGLDFNQPYLEGGGQKWETSPSMSHWEDMARRVQDDSEHVLLERAKWLQRTTGAKNLVMAGGVALNCVANGRIVREAGFDNVWIQPAAGDDGIAIGCAYYGQLELQKQPRKFVMTHAYLGEEYTKKDIAEAASTWSVRLQTSSKQSDDICTDAAQLLAEGYVFGWFQGRSEFGPRALGNRSILADPRQPEMKEKINEVVKHRQPFRPFAPIVLADRSSEIFEGEEESPFMLLVKKVKPEWKERVAAIVHVDGTARVQTVRRETNERLYRLLQEFDRITGVPVLLNTSFNIRGEPIVETPEDAVRCFLTTGIDYLVLHDLLIGKNPLHKIVSPVINAYSEVDTMVRAGLRENGADRSAG